MSRFDEDFREFDPELTAPDLGAEAKLGAAARALREHELYGLLMRELKFRIWEKFSETPLRDIDGLQRLRMLQEAVELFDGILVDTAATGMLAVGELTEQESSATEAD